MTGQIIAGADPSDVSEGDAKYRSLLYDVLTLAAGLDRSTVWRIKFANCSIKFELFKLFAQTNGVK